MQLAGLAKLIGPPPTKPFAIDWPGIERTLGLALPDDYKAFADAYGPCRIGESLAITVPFWNGPGAYMSYFSTIELESDAYRVMRDENPDKHPYAFHPEPGGLLHCAWGADADGYFWDTSVSANPNEWTVVARQGARPEHGRGEETWVSFAMSLTDLLAMIVEEDRRRLASPPQVTRYDAYKPYSMDLPDTTRPTPPVSAMSSAVDRIVARLEVSGMPATAGPWRDSVPADYRALMKRIGPGTIDGALRLLAPSAPDGFDNDEEQARHGTMLRRGREFEPRTVHAAVAPEPGGLVLWGVFTTGETLWWLPAWPDPDGWPTVVCSADGIGWQRLDSSSTNVLDAWMDGRLRDLPVLQASGRPSGARYIPAGATITEAARQPTWDDIATPQAQLASVLGPGRNQRRFDLAETEQSLGLSLPSDYKQILHSYGTDPHDGINIHAPGATLDLIACQKAAAEHGNAVGFWPDPGGLLVCASTEGRDRIMWETSNPDPDAWPLVIIDQFGDRRRFNGTLTELLIATCTGRWQPALTYVSPSRPPNRISLEQRS